MIKREQRLSWKKGVATKRKKRWIRKECAKKAQKKWETDEEKRERERVGKRVKETSEEKEERKEERKEGLLAYDSRELLGRQEGRKKVRKKKH